MLCFSLTKEDLNSIYRKYVWKDGEKDKKFLSGSHSLNWTILYILNIVRHCAVIAIEMNRENQENRTEKSLMDVVMKKTEVNRKC